MFPSNGLFRRAAVVPMLSSERMLRLIFRLSTPAYHTPLDDIQQERYDLSDHFVADRQSALGR
jgi:hypothetical protein